MHARASSAAERVVGAEANTGPRCGKLGSARRLEPLLHGDRCGGLSGVYSLVNALRLALADKRPLAPKEQDLLLAAGLRYMSGRLTPERAIVCGLRVSLWRGLAKALVAYVEGLTRIRVMIEPLGPNNLEGRCAAFQILEQAIDRLSVPAMLCRGGHYTVVSGFTPSSLLLFDSGGACWIAKSACGVPGDRSAALHLIYPSSFLALST